MKFYLLRHGQTDWNLEGRLQGHKNIPMNRNGVKQMMEIAEHLHEINFKVDYIISSPLDRAKESARIVAEKIEFSGNIIYDDKSILIVAHGAILSAVKHALSNGTLGYYDSSVPIIQGNILCCEIGQNGEQSFYNLF